MRLSILITLKIISYLRLFRFPAVFTAVADILCGYFIVNPVWEKEISALFFLIVSSAFLYTSGMVLNDYFDYEVDKLERPQRPLPAGDISRPNAFIIGILFSGVGVIFAYFVGMQSLYVSLFLLVTIFLYNSVTKNHSMIGPINMGMCRFLNMTLGMSVFLYEIGWKSIFPSFIDDLYHWGDHSK